MDNNQLVQFNQQQALITSQLETVGSGTEQLQSQLHDSARDIQRLMTQLDERYESQYETNRTFETRFEALGQVLQQQQGTFLEQFNHQNEAIRQLVGRLDARTESSAPLDTNTDLHTPSHSTGTGGEAPVPPEAPVSTFDNSIVKTQLPLIPPRVYKGERKDNACEQWCMDMHSFMRRYETLTGKSLSDEQAVEYIAQYFSDAALNWWTTLVFNAQQNIPGLNMQKPTSESELYSKLRSNFGDIHSVERRREKYESLKQTGSVQDFANKLKHTVLFLDPIPPAYEILRRFQNGLRPDIRAKMDEFHGDVKTLDEYIHKADDIDRTQHRIKQTERRKEADQAPEQGRSYAIGSQIPSQKTDSVGYKTWCKNNRACFLCASKKHQAKKCPKKDSIEKESGKASHPQA